MSSAAGDSNNTPPPGSKPPQNTAPQATFMVLEIPPGMDIVACVKHFAQTNNASVNVLSGCGMLSRVAYRHPSSPHPVILFEPLNLVSIAGRVNPAEPGYASFTATITRLNGSVLGVRPFHLLAMDSVVLTALVTSLACT